MDGRSYRWPLKTTNANLFTFTAGPRPACPLVFAGTASATTPASAETDDRSWRRPKRHRPVTDVDGEQPNQSRNKKRRLRRDLITSRLSRPFSAPPTYIVDRGSSKIAVWAKQRHLGSNHLRKVAIMNDLRMRVAQAQRAKRWQMEVARHAFMYAARTWTWPSPSACRDTTLMPGSRCRRPRSSTTTCPSNRPYLPRPPSPAACSNYDVLDREDEEEAAAAAAAMDEEEATTPEAGRGPAIYSDFRIMEPNEPVIADEYEALDGLPPPWPTDRPPSPPEEKALELIRERERQKELSFVELGGA